MGVCMLLAVLVGCGRNTGNAGSGKTTILAAGSDTMVNLAQAWAEVFCKSDSRIRVQVIGGGSGVGIASLTDGTCDIANTSRKMKEKEIERIKAKHGTEPKEFIVGYDALAVYVHRDNPIDSISIEKLAEIYGEGGAIEDWSKVDGRTADLGEIIRVSRQNNSGTYAYFREAVLGKKKDYKLGSVDQSGSKDVVALVGRTIGAIGYSGMGYATPEVKMLKISKAPGEPGVAPTVENAKDGTYPITRPLLIYTVGEPTGTVKEYLDWILSVDGQKVVSELGYVPVGGDEQ
jgi:phosphate transport system substrate-binding protein